ncbi:hypothetical protein ERY430_80015 [Erythrobacter sp. EC-HK427]|nr:hypothetical protein ERY430_80015 [Erythrobacter sp. EC-HK427]
MPVPHGRIPYTQTGISHHVASYRQDHFRFVQRPLRQIARQDRRPHQCARGAARRFLR